jgi:putative hydrolase of the HAD superfamily
MLTHLGPPDPGTLHLLDALDAGRIPWGVVTNGSAAQLDRVRALGLAERPTCVVVSEVVGLRKPDPAIFLLGAERLGAGLGRTLFVGDNPKADIVGARRTGMRTAWLRHGRDWPASLLPVAPDLTLDGLGDLLPLLGLDEAQGP